jgi:hypothetical protein
MHTQCLFIRDGAKQMAWIASRGAVVGRKVELKETGEFWTVHAVYDTVDDAVVKTNERQYRDHRKATDI